MIAVARSPDGRITLKTLSFSDLPLTVALMSPADRQLSSLVRMTARVAGGESFWIIVTEVVGSMIASAGSGGLSPPARSFLRLSLDLTFLALAFIALNVSELVSVINGALMSSYLRFLTVDTESTGGD